MANLVQTRPTFTAEQKEAWQHAKKLLSTYRLGKQNISADSHRALHIAMSELRAQNGRQHKGPIETLPKRDEKRVQYLALWAQSQIAARVAEWKAYLTNPGAKKLYILIDNGLTPAQKAVQASHCAAQFQKEHPLAPWVNGTMILLEHDGPMLDWRKNPQTLDQFARNQGWDREGFWLTLWREPDMEDKITAIAITSDYRADLIGKTRGLKLI